MRHRAASHWPMAVVFIAVVAVGRPAAGQPAPAPPAADPADRLKALEESNRRLTERLEQFIREADGQLRPPSDRTQAPGERTGAAPAADARRYPDPGSSPVPDYTEGAFGPLTATPSLSDSAGSRPSRFPLRATFGPGVRLETEDEEFSLNIHYESQVEGRLWGQAGQDPTNSGFYLPRQRFFFDGTLTRGVEYELAINRGLNNINLLNAYLNFHLNDRVQFRVGRFFTPFTYDQYSVSNYWLLTPERALFTTNFGLNRQIGAMAWGYLLDKQVDYSVGVFNGSRNSFESQHRAVDVVGYVNTRPFQNSARFEAARFLNLGSSVGFGRQDQSPVPATLRVGAGSPDANIPSTATVPFLTFNRGVVERGDRLVGSVHAAYFYRGLSLIGEWQYGYGGYASADRPATVYVPFGGYYVAGGYFLTGEHVERRTRVRPLRPLIPIGKDDRRGAGAWELAGRVSQVQMNDRVFTGGFADPAIWSNDATTTELGLNWYLNEYLKVSMFWLRAEFGSPVQYRAGRLQEAVDMLWLRCQLYF